MVGSFSIICVVLLLCLLYACQRMLMWKEKYFSTFLEVQKLRKTVKSQRETIDYLKITFELIKDSIHWRRID